MKRLAEGADRLGASYCSRPAPPTAPSDVASNGGRIQQQDRALYASKSCVAMSIRLFSAVCMLLARASLCKCGRTTEKWTHGAGWLETRVTHNPHSWRKTDIKVQNTESRKMMKERHMLWIENEKREVSMTTTSYKHKILKYFSAVIQDFQRIHFWIMVYIVSLVYELFINC